MQARQEKATQHGDGLLLSMTLDEMSIMTLLQFDGNRFWGEVDLGGGIETRDTEVLATQVLVMMIVAVNQGWKIPLAYFFVNGLDGPERASIVNLALSR